MGTALGSLASPWVIAATPALSISVDARSPLSAIKHLAEQDLGIILDLRITTAYSSRLQEVILNPYQCQLAEFRSNNTTALWRSAAIRPVELDRLHHWPELSATLNAIENPSNSNPSVTTYGSPVRTSLYVHDNGLLGSTETALASYVPFCLSNEALAYNPDLMPGELLRDPGWSWMLDEKLRGRIAVSNSPAGSYYDLALATLSGSPGLIADPGAPTLEELRSFYQKLMALAANGQFSTYWGQAEDIVESFATGRTLATNLLAQDIPLIRSRGINLRQANPAEGFRGWTNGLYLTRPTADGDQVIAYEFLNWLMSGAPANAISRMGYTTSTPELARNHMSTNDWGYWYDGKPTSEFLYDPDGYEVAGVGESRVGGGYHERFNHIGLWVNAPLPHMDVILQSWGRLLGSG